MTKPVMVLRNVKAAALTHSEHDQNFINLRDATISLVAGTGGTAVASDLNGSITLVAGTNVTLSGDNTAKTITINAANESQNIFQNIAVAGQSTVSADTTSDTLTLVAGTNVSITTDAATDSITINNTAPGGNAFGTVAVPGQTSVVADSVSDTLTISSGRIAGDQDDGIFMGMRIVTNALNDVVIIGHRSSSFITRNSTTKASPFIPYFDPLAVSGGGAIQRIPITAGDGVDIALPNGMIAGDSMRLIIVNKRTVSVIMDIDSGYKISRNTDSRYFEETDSTPYTYSLSAATAPDDGGILIINVLYDGVNYYADINTDYI